MHHNRQKLMVAAWISAVTLVVLTTATYAWMSIASILKVTDLSLNVITDNALEIAQDVAGQPGAWSTVLNLDGFEPASVNLSPVTWSQADTTFYAPRYGLDGRPTFTEPLQVARVQTGNPVPVPDAIEQSGFLLAFDVWVRTSASNCGVELSEPLPVNDTQAGYGTFVIGKPIWNATAVRHDDGGSGAQNALRIAFLSYDEPDGLPGKFILYEPNANSSGEIMVTPAIDGSAGLTTDDYRIVQAVSTWQEQDPVLRDQVSYTMGNFLNEPVSLFNLKAGHPRRISVFIWLEGQDSECTNAIASAQLQVNLQFKARTELIDDPIVAR
ncbi:MAG: hypothetical protein EOM70_08175 [Clostridia bacterium]|nr:hypothetical protein [Clostridia bacterium]